MDYIIANYDRIAITTLRHLELCGISLGLALLLGIPVGIVAAKLRGAGVLVLGAVSVIYTIPTLAMFGFMIPILGLGTKPAIVAVMLYSLLPIVQNTYTGILGVRPEIREAARGMGMNGWHLLTRVEMPLALVVIFAGIRTAVVSAVGLTTLASLIGAGGLGDLVFRGISTVSLVVVLAGSVPIIVIAVLADLGLKAAETRLARKITGLAVVQ